MLDRSQAHDRTRALFVVVLDAFFGLQDGVLTARHDRLDQIRARTEGRGHFGRLDDAQPTAGASADEDDATTFAEGLSNEVNADGDTVFFTLDCDEHLAIL